MSVPTTNISFSAMANAIGMTLTNVKYSYFYKGSSYLTLFPLLSTTNTGSPLTISTFKSRSYASYPGAPTINSVTASGPFNVNIVVNAPSNNGGSAIITYTAVSSPDNIVCTSTTTSISVSGLTCNRSYTFTVYASNSAGNSTSSGASSAVITLVFNSNYRFSAGAGGALGQILGGNTGGGGAGGLLVTGVTAVKGTSGGNTGVNGGGAGYGGTGFGAGGGGGGYWIGMGYDPGGNGAGGCAYIIGPTGEYFTSSNSSYNAPTTGNYAILLIGGGGGGGGANSGIHGGGGAGYITTATINVNAGQLFMCYIGGGGGNNGDGGASAVDVYGIVRYNAGGGQTGGSNNNGGAGSSSGGGAQQAINGRHAGWNAGNSPASGTSSMGTTAFYAAIATVLHSP